MTPEKQLTTIAEAYGWTHIENISTIRIRGHWVGYPPKSPIIGEKETLPDYLNDLNACHEMKKVLTDEQKNSFRDYLLTITTNLTSWGDFDMGEDLQSMIDATPLQQAEAFLKTLGKWSES